MKKLKFLLSGAFCTILMIVIIYCSFQIGEIFFGYVSEERIHNSLMKYKPDDINSRNSEKLVNNQNLIDLKAEYKDVIGWLTVPDTKIDYPFVRCNDNDYYLYRDLDENYAMAGTIFMDYRCSEDFSSQNTIIYGHNMRNGSMFGTLKAFQTKSFFDKNLYGTLFLPHNTAVLEFFAYMVINAETEKEVYNISVKDTYFDYVEKNAIYYRNIGITKKDNIVTLSTCSYDFENARLVLLARMKHI